MDAFEVLKTNLERACKVFHEALENVSTTVEVRSEESVVQHTRFLLKFAPKASLALLLGG